MTQQIKLKIRKGDQVIVVAGKHKKQTGRVIAVYPRQMRVLVEGINLCIKRIKPNVQMPQGKIQTVEAPLHISNVMLLDPSTNKPSRVGRRLSDTGATVRYYKHSKQEVRES